MQINGLNNIEEEFRPILLSFIGSHYDDSSIINVDMSNDYNDLIIINDGTFYIGNLYVISDILRDANDEYFENCLCEEVPKEWRSYIDKEAWIDDNGMSETEAIARLFDKEDCTLVDRINNYNIYNV